MKQNFSKILLLSVIALLFSTCETFITEDVSGNPNEPTTIPLLAHLPAIQINLVDMYGGQFSRFNSLTVQYVEGVARGCYYFGIYTGMEPTSFDKVWENVYEKVLNETRIAKNTAETNGFNHYLAILEILDAFTILAASDQWDDMPYSQTAPVINNLNPTYDRQEQIYATALSNLDKAIELINKSTGGAVPAGDDLFYQGDMNKWMKTAHAIKARSFLKQKRYSEALEEAELAFDSPEDNLAFQYPGEPSVAPWYRFIRDRTGDIELHPQFKNLLLSLNDMDRLAKWEPTFWTTHPYFVADFNQELISYRELQFIIAEADFRINSGATNKTYEAYLAGISAAFQHLDLQGEPLDEYLENLDINPGQSSITLEKIMTQKYIAQFTMPEAYSDWRRTNIPTLLPASGPAIPVRWQYPATEYDLNENAPNEATIDIYNDRVGWNN